MEQKFINKLSLKSGNKLNTVKVTAMEASNYPPSNQEAFITEDNDFDSDFDDLDLTEENEESDRQNELDIAFDAVNQIREKYDDRLDVAKAREWMVYAKRSNKTPPFCYIKLRCTPNFRKKDIEETFNKSVQEIYEETKTLFYTKTIEVMDRIIKEKGEEAAAIRKRAKENIGAKTTSAGEARKTLHLKLNELKGKCDREINEHKNEIRTSVLAEYSEKRPRGVGRYARGSFRQRGRGRYH